MFRRRMLRSNKRQAAAREDLSVCLRDESRQSPILRFNPTAWAKLLYLRDLGDTEVGGFGISAADDPLYIEDVQLVQQACTGVSVAFDDQAVADFFDQQVDQGRRPESHEPQMPRPFRRLDIQPQNLLAGRRSDHRIG